MSLVHICTSESLSAGMESIPAQDCSLCGHKTLNFDYCGATCWTCGLDIGVPAHRNIKRARENLFITRRQFAALTNYAYSTVKKYDFCGGSQPYLEKSFEVLKCLYSNLRMVQKCKDRHIVNDNKIIENLIAESFEEVSHE